MVVNPENLSQQIDPETKAFVFPEEVSLRVPSLIQQLALCFCVAVFSSIVLIDEEIVDKNEKLEEESNNCYDNE